MLSLGYFSFFINGEYTHEAQKKPESHSHQVMPLEAMPKQWSVNLTVDELILNAIKEPRYYPFTNRTPLVCPNADSLPNGIGSICNPCGVKCEGMILML